MRFKQGNKVEILKTNEENHGSWFPAKVLSVHGDRYTIRYELYFTSEGKPAVETVSEEDVRPRPPPASSKEKWVVGDIAELFDLHSWKLGKVAKVLRNDHIVARLFGSIQLKEFHMSSLRVHQAWHNNTWIVIDKACEEKQYRNGYDKHSSSGHADFNAGACRGLQDEKKWTAQGYKQNSIPCNPSAGTLKRNLSSRGSLFPGYVARGTCKRRKTNTRTNGHHQVTGKELPEMVDAFSSSKAKVGEDCPNANSKSKTIRHAQMDSVSAYTNNCAINSSSIPARVTEDNNECSVASCSGIEFPRCSYKGNSKSSRFTASLDDAASLCPYGSGKGHQSASGDEIAANVHELELHAYQTTMQALHASGPLSWEQESLLTNLRISLNISIEEHSLHLRQLLSA